MAKNFKLMQKRKSGFNEPKLELTDLKDPLMRLIRSLFEQEQYGALRSAFDGRSLREYFLFCDEIWQSLGHKLGKNDDIWSSFPKYHFDVRTFKASKHHYTAIEYSQVAPRYGFNIYGVSKGLNFFNTFEKYSYEADHAIDVLLTHPEFDIKTVPDRLFKLHDNNEVIIKILNYAPHMARKIVYNVKSFMDDGMLDELLARGCNPILAAEYYIFDFVIDFADAYADQGSTINEIDDALDIIGKYCDLKSLFPKLPQKFPHIFEVLEDDDSRHYIEILVKHGFNPFELDEEGYPYITDMLDIVYELENKKTDPLTMSAVRAKLDEFITIRNNWSLSNRQFETAEESLAIKYLLHKDDNVIFDTPLHILLPYEIKELIIRNMLHYDYELDENYESDYGDSDDEDELEYYYGDDDYYGSEDDSDEDEIEII